MHKQMFSFSGGFGKMLFNWGGPYNPYKYKDYLVPRSFPTNKEIYDVVRNHEDIVAPPVRNMRHINPVRQSGPLPAYSGTYTM